MIDYERLIICPTNPKIILTEKQDTEKCTQKHGKEYTAEKSMMGSSSIIDPPVHIGRKFGSASENSWFMNEDKYVTTSSQRIYPLTGPTKSETIAVVYFLFKQVLAIMTLTFKED